MRTDMTDQTVQVPTDVAERYHAHEPVVHELERVNTNGD